jgi:hypothetical protein
MIHKLTKDNYEDFLRQRRATAVHFDAAWDVAGRIIARQRMTDAAGVLGEQANFGEVDCDLDPDLARSLRVITVPSVAYYLDGNLVAVLPGARQNIRQRLERLLQGEEIGRNDGLAHDIAAPNFWTR